MHEIHQILGMFKKILPRKLDHSSIIKVLRVDFLENVLSFWIQPLSVNFCDHHQCADRVSVGLSYDACVKWHTPIWEEICRVNKNTCQNLGP